MSVTGRLELVEGFRAKYRRYLCANFSCVNCLEAGKRSNPRLRSMKKTMAPDFMKESSAKERS
jgi:hypothetical protein